MDHHHVAGAVLWLVEIRGQETVDAAVVAVERGLFARDLHIAQAVADRESVARGQGRAGRFDPGHRFRSQQGHAVDGSAADEHSRQPGQVAGGEVGAPAGLPGMST